MALLPDAWKTNHWIYELEPLGLSKNELTELVRSGYHNYIASWKNVRELVGFLRTILVNSSARKIVLMNLFNGDLRKLLSEDIMRINNRHLR